MNDVVFNKKESLERCIAQIRKYYAGSSDCPFEQDYFKQDAIAINLQRACEQCIDMANHVIRVKKLGLVKASRESFDVLAREQLISNALAATLVGMVGFRNTLVHQYQDLDIGLMKKVIEEHLDDLLEFSRLMMLAVFDD